MGTVRRQFAAACSLALVLAASPGQCGTQWQPGQGVPGLSGNVGVARSSALWDPDGSGPMASRLVVAGDFTLAGDTVTVDIASWDLATGSWSPIGAIGAVGEIAPLPSGHLAVTSGYGNRVHVWNGSSWSPLPSLPWSPRTLVAMPNGDLVASFPDYVPNAWFPSLGYWVDQLYRWNGSAWLAIGPGMYFGTVNALVVLGNGDIVAAGDFTQIGTTAMNRIARWDGTTWHPLGAGLNGRVDGLVVAPSGDVVALGPFTSAGGAPANQVARWDGTAWSPLGGGVSGGAFTLAAMSNGDIYVGGALNTGAGSPVGFITKWNGSTWSPAVTDLESRRGSGSVWALTGLPNGDLFVGGAFRRAGGNAALGAAIWDGNSWHAMGSGLDTRVEAMITLADGDLLTGGFWAFRLRRWDGTSWQSTGPPGNTTSFARLPNGDIVAGGYFEVAPGTYVPVIRWDGSTWSPLGTGLLSVAAIASLPSGDIVVGVESGSLGGFPGNRVGRWNGTAWTALGGSVDGPVRALTRLSNGDLIAGGSFTNAGGVPARSIARWDGTVWSALGAGYDGTVNAVLELPSGDLMVAGLSASATWDTVQIWNGSTWTPIGMAGPQYGGGSVHALLSLPDGDVLAGGAFTHLGGQPADYIARWEGTSWSPVAGGLDGVVHALAMLPNGDLFAGGDFHTANGIVSAYAARLTATCPATTSVIATACSGWSGPVTLRTESLPWIGSTYRSLATGFGANPVAAAVLGFSSPAIPLSTIHPAGLANCSLLASADVVRLSWPQLGAESYELAIPGDLALVGIQLYHQFVQAEFGLGGAFAISSSNGVTITIGVF